MGKRTLLAKAAVPFPLVFCFLKNPDTFGVIGALTFTRPEKYFIFIHTNYL